MNPLLEKLNEIIKTKGPITFKDFMQMALYYPGLGYYTSPGEKIGPRGDFYTSSDVHPLFGTMLARQFYQMWEYLGKPQSWALVEWGAGKGLLALHILEALGTSFPLAWKGLHYYIIEASPEMIKKQKELLTSFPQGKLSWVNNLSEAGDNGHIKGIIFGNELVDAFPVHRVRQTNSGLKEIYVNWDEGKLVEVEGELSTPLLEEYFQTFGIKLVPGQTAEVNLAAREWLREVATKLEQGFVLLIDYGMESPELYHPSRMEGTLRCFRQHRLNNNPLNNVGQQDITAHVDFSALTHWGREAGLQPVGYTTQMDFLLNLGILEAIPRSKPEYVFDEKATRTVMAVKKLLLPEGMGRVFKVLAFAKGVGKPDLLGFVKKKTD
ncbi:class I SAM-dependent methyltransferase [Desulfofundulus thermocisternus]|uniref:class I SAM-dependent methyltransferase n=1 Tax=Desulfofundulus thermocisternus TaxID=42471 RepID=UPI001A08D03A|nr:SAM-dependent methyltransferase [Desulfofundulus thermocisternus]MBE3585772.1 SAM-dependent methyltransferase [Thermoanaerobacter sp.]MCS5696359.1 SAM-dependent methyltransferase [Desulfofundulus thermocisternus]